MKYQHIANALHYQTSDWEAGTQLPSEKELMAAFNATRTTVRHALAVLVQQGHIYRTQGVGTFRLGPDGQRGERIPRKYDNVADGIRAEIADVAPGERLDGPTVWGLRYGVSYPTIREAVRILAAEGLINHTRGKYLRA